MNYILCELEHRHPLLGYLKRKSGQWSIVKFVKK